jgi:lambda family phage portal protein
MKFNPWDPKYPDAQHEMFVNTILRGISSGLGVSFNMLANNLERVNYSSIRAGLLDERELWKLLQQWFIESFMQRVFSSWLEMALLRGAIELPFELAQFNKPIFVGKRWPWVDPLKDSQATIQDIQACLTTRTRAIAETGEDREEVDQERAEEIAAAKELGLEPTVDAPATKGGAPPAASGDQVTADEQDAEEALLQRAEEVLAGKKNGS